jgi:hypothetical protein
MPYLQQSWEVYSLHPVNKLWTSQRLCPRESYRNIQLPDTASLVAVCVLPANSHTRVGNDHLARSSLSHEAVHFI